MMMETHYLGANAANFKKPLSLKELLIDVDESPRRKRTPSEIKAMLMLSLGGPKKNG